LLDIIIVALILLLSIKGFFNGLIRELVGFVGLIGGVFVASRSAESLSKYLQNMLHMDQAALLKLVAFLIVLGAIWGGSSILATIFSALRAKPHTIAENISGMLIAGLKYTLIFAMLISSLFNNALLRDNFAHTIQKSYLFYKLNTIGGNLLSLAPKTTKHPKEHN